LKKSFSEYFLAEIFIEMVFIHQIPENILLLCFSVKKSQSINMDNWKLDKFLGKFICSR
jgi:hypothetical protein